MYMQPLEIEKKREKKEEISLFLLFPTRTIFSISWYYYELGQGVQILNHKKGHIINVFSCLGITHVNKMYYYILTDH